MHLQNSPVAIGVSGGLDSTLALLFACRTADWIGMERSRIYAFTMPGFGTTAQTKKKALASMQYLGVSSREIDIRPLCLEEMRRLGHRPFGIALDRLTVEELTTRVRQLAPEEQHDLVFENIQARMRMNLLMNTAFVIGTGDLSELALGWASYNGDHMSMHNPNVSIPVMHTPQVGWKTWTRGSTEARTDSRRSTRRYACEERRSTWQRAG